jgi:hypothetical protein
MELNTMELNTALDTAADCKFCSVVSKANGEDPIGTAGTHDHWLIVELPQPWSAKLLEAPTLKPLVGLMQTLILQHQVKLRPIVIAPDAEYSQPGYTRILYYHRPRSQFATFEKQEFLVPEADTTRCATALLHHIANQPNDLATFQAHQVAPQPMRELLVCTHGNVDIACARFGYPIYKILRDRDATHSNGRLRVWRCSHFGGHQFAPTLIDLPTGQYWGRLEPELLDSLVHHTGDVAQLRSCYRGWSGLSKFEQIAEREIWQQVGWEWLNYPKLGRTIAVDQGRWHWLRQLLRLIPSKRLRFLLDHRPHAASWAIVSVEFTTPDGNKGKYEARIAATHSVMTAQQSGDRLKLQSVNQYRVMTLKIVD